MNGFYFIEELMLWKDSQENFFHSPFSTYSTQKLKKGQNIHYLCFQFAFGFIALYTTVIHTLHSGWKRQFMSEISSYTLILGSKTKLKFSFGVRKRAIDFKAPELRTFTDCKDFSLKKSFWVNLKCKNRFHFIKYKKITHCAQYIARLWKNLLTNTLQLQYTAINSFLVVDITV